MIWTIVFLLAGAGCLGLAVWRLRQWFHRRKGIRIEAGIVDRRYQIPDDGTGIVDNKECGASVDLSFFWQGRSYRKVQDYKGILSVPAPEDKSVPVLFWPETGEWELWTRKRPYWLLLFPGAVFLIATGIALLIGGEGFAPMSGAFGTMSPIWWGSWSMGPAPRIWYAGMGGTGFSIMRLVLHLLIRKTPVAGAAGSQCIMIIPDHYERIRDGAGLAEGFVAEQTAIILRLDRVMADRKISCENCQEGWSFQCKSVQDPDWEDSARCGFLLAGLQSMECSPGNGGVSEREIKRRMKNEQGIRGDERKKKYP